MNEVALSTAALSQARLGTRVVTYTHAVRIDGPELAAMARRAFEDTFDHLFPADHLWAHLDRAYGRNGLLADLHVPAIEFRCAKVDGRIVGYAKLAPLAAPISSPAPDALELQQIYVLSPWHGSGIASGLMAWALDRARQRGASELYLTVFDHNERAKRFYTRHGFVDVGRCWFELGGQKYEDRIWQRLL